MLSSLLLAGALSSGEFLSFAKSIKRVDFSKAKIINGKVEGAYFSKINKNSNNPSVGKYKLRPNDLDWRGTGRTYQDALDEAFKKTGIPKEKFEVIKMEKNVYGKFHPVEWKHTDSHAEVNIDFKHPTTSLNPESPDLPHVGWRVGKGSKRVSGHILLDEVPYGRDRP